MEAFAVLTRLPPPHRAPAGLVVEFLSTNFPDQPILLRGDGCDSLLRRAAESGIRGGAIYDALIAATAKQEADLFTLDHRALPTYERLGATVRYLE